MSKETIVFVLGILIFLTPYMGLPREYKDWLFLIVGFLLIAVGYRLRRLAFLRSLDDGNGRKKNDVFAESNGVHGAPHTATSKQETHI